MNISRSVKARKSIQSANASTRPQSIMYTERNLIKDAGKFLNGKNIYDGNLLENKGYAYHVLKNK